MFGQGVIPVGELLRVLECVDQLLGLDVDDHLDPVDLLAVLLLAGHDDLATVALFLLLPAVLGVDDVPGFIPSLVDDGQKIRVL